MADGRLAYRLKTPWRDGTTHVVMERRELLERLAPLIPPPRAHQVRYHGILAPCASGRDRIVPGRETNELARQPVKDEPSCLATQPTTWIDGPNEGLAAHPVQNAGVVPLPTSTVLSGNLGQLLRWLKRSRRARAGPRACSSQARAPTDC
jgi:hypothetical protein